ncbi:hypothetical protein ACFE04_021612 [Oxalis oulophora]
MSCSPDNLPPGTIIDKQFYHPRNNDFYFCAHARMIGHQGQPIIMCCWMRLGLRGTMHGRGRLSGSCSSAESKFFSWKRPRKDGYGGGGLFYLNLSAEVIDRN